MLLIANMTQNEAAEGPTTTRSQGTARAPTRRNRFLNVTGAFTRIPMQFTRIRAGIPNINVTRFLDVTNAPLMGTPLITHDSADTTMMMVAMTVAGTTTMVETMFVAMLPTLEQTVATLTSRGVALLVTLDDVKIITFGAPGLDMATRVEMMVTIPMLPKTVGAEVGTLMTILRSRSCMLMLVPPQSTTTDKKTPCPLIFPLKLRMTREVANVIAMALEMTTMVQVIC